MKFKITLKIDRQYGDSLPFTTVHEIPLTFQKVTN